MTVSIDRSHIPVRCAQCKKPVAMVQGETLVSRNGRAIIIVGAGHPITVGCGGCGHLNHLTINKADDAVR